MFKLTKKLVATAAALLAAGVAYAQDSGPLIELLIRKGVINDQEAEELRAELLKDFAANSPAGKLDLSSRVNRLTLALDGRIRYQYDNETTNSPGAAGPNNDRSRYRYRFRLSANALLSQNWSLGLRLETANGATSTNDDFGAAGSTNFAKDGNVAYVGQFFIQYASNNAFGGAVDNFDVRLGKHAHPFFTPGVNGFWIDSDINFEGVSEQLTWFDAPAKGWNLALRAGQYILANNARLTVGSSFTNTPSVMWVGQAEFSRQQVVEGNSYGTRVAPTFVAFSAPSIASDVSSYDDLVSLILPVEHTIRVHERPLALYATYGVNLSGDKRTAKLYPVGANKPDYDTMFNAGLRYGATRNPGDWQVTAEYRSVEAGAYSGLLLDSDFGAGRTNVRGPIASFSYNLTDAVNFTTTWFHAENIDQASPSSVGYHKADVVQFDLSARF
ncbi:MAG: putative porin [Candidatus Didemnitutus sp.]|nr:putative porin [Candidatus Didemnitutus sp.]